MKPFLRIALFIAAGTILFSAGQARACNPCSACPAGDVTSATSIIKTFHSRGESDITGRISLRFAEHKAWLLDTFFKTEVLPALQMFTEQMSAVATQQVFMIGGFLDAKQQLETQRDLQLLQFQAHKDYQPSEGFCQFGTNVRSLAASEELGKTNVLALNSRQMARHLGKANIAGTTQAKDKINRWKQFTTTYCDPQDNGWLKDNKDTGLALTCGQGASDPQRMNRDIDFTRLIEEPRTLNVAFAEDKTGASPDEEDVIALGNNLYGHSVLTRRLDKEKLKDLGNQELYFALRSVAAKRSVAESSYNAIVGLKSNGSSDTDSNNPQTRKFLAAVMKELGMPEEEIYEVIGDRPSYYAQLEILAKKIYQNPDFFANLYDTPVNVERQSVALKAIDLMLDRAIYESQLRQEMAMSVLLSSKLEPRFEKSQGGLQE